MTRNLSNPHNFQEVLEAMHAATLRDERSCAIVSEAYIPHVPNVPDQYKLICCSLDGTNMEFQTPQNAALSMRCFSTKSKSHCAVRLVFTFILYDILADDNPLIRQVI